MPRDIPTEIGKGYRECGRMYINNLGGRSFCLDAPECPTCARCLVHCLCPLERMRVSAATVRAAMLKGGAA